jgi:hypothetical protein
MEPGFMKLFTFDPAEHARAFAAHGYVHIRGGLSRDFYTTLVRKCAGDSGVGRPVDPPDRLILQQDIDCYRQLREAVSGVCGLETADLVMSRCHLQSYGADTPPLPPVHKEPFSAQVAIAAAIHTSPGSVLALWPSDDISPNPFCSAQELRASLLPEQDPEVLLADGERVEILEAPRDVVIYQGNAMWHRREQAAGSKVLQIHFNTSNCDPLGQDPFSPLCRDRSNMLLSASDDDFRELVVLVGREVDSFQRRYTRDWQDTLGVQLHGSHFLGVDETEWVLLHEVDGFKTVMEVIAAAGLVEGGCARVRRLAACGLLDLIQPKLCGQAHAACLAGFPSHGAPFAMQLQLDQRR